MVSECTFCDVLQTLAFEALDSGSMMYIPLAFDFHTIFEYHFIMNYTIKVMYE
jgi:hypothetical protein